MTSAAPVTLTDTAGTILITGVPGSFKSTRAVHYLDAAVKLGEQVYFSNFTGLKIPGAMECKDPRKWQELPPGSILVIDEAQDAGENGFRTRRTGEPPDYIRELSKVRKYGIRIIFITQSPTYLDSHLRGIIGRHEHMVRKDGADSATIYVRSGNGAFDDVREEKTLKRKADDQFKYTPPEAINALHESAVVHTMKRRLSHRTRLALVVVSIAVVGLALAWGGAIRGALAKEDAATALAASGAPSARTTGQAASASDAVSPASFAASMQPRIPGAMWSAPLFDGRPVVSEPRSLCMSSADSCTCMSEQGTRVVEPRDVCRYKARHGEPYNPYRRQEPESMQREEEGGFRPPETAQAVPQSGTETPHAVALGDRS